MTEPRLLLVEDEPTLRMTLAANLELGGFAVAEAEDAEQALRRLQAGAFDVVLSDIRMPGMHGVDLFRRIRAAWPELPVVLMSAFALEQLIDDAIQEGVFTVLAKPFNVERVLGLLRFAARRPLVLVVDDETAEATAEALRLAGVRAESVHGAAAALSLVQIGRVDVAVVDLATSGRSGADIIDELLAADASLAIIAVSGHPVSVPSGAPGSSDLLRRAAARGVYACMTKPIGARDLVATIARARGSAYR